MILSRARVTISYGLLVTVKEALSYARMEEKDKVNEINLTSLIGEILIFRFVAINGSFEHFFDILKYIGKK